MATYASSSNPFIKTNTRAANESSCVVELAIDAAPKRKDAPGMAMPHNRIVTEKPVTCNDKEDADVVCGDASAGPPVDFPKAEEDKLDTTVDLNSNFLETQPIDEEDESKCEFDEITKACESLVETTIRLELEEAAFSSSSSSSKKKKEKRTCADEASALTRHHESGQEEHRGAIEMVLVDASADADADGDTDGDAEELVNSGHRQHLELIKKLRLQLRDLERYAYERGELGQVPASVISERQTVILDTLKERLSLSIDMDEIEKLELDELKKQVDKEIHDLIDPLITKDHLLGQLKSQLTDLERYISYLHGTIGKIHDKSTCSCHVHGCCTKKLAELSLDDNNSTTNTNQREYNESRLINNDALPKTSKLIRSLVTQMICSDIKLRETAKKAQILEENYSKSDANGKRLVQGGASGGVVQSAPARAVDDAAWTLHLDKVILATDSLVNLFSTEPEYQRTTDGNTMDDRLVESIVRRQLVPAIRDLLSYGLIDLSSMPKSTSYVSLLFDPYYLLTSLTCFPGSNRTNSPIGGDTRSSQTSTVDKVHLWNVIEEYYQSRNDPTFKTSSVKTLSQSFDLAPSISGPIKITSKQALLIAIDDINETLSRSKPNGPEAHFRAFIYTALNRAKLTTWLRIVFKNKSVIKKFYHNFSFVGQPDKMDKLLATTEPLNQLSLKLRTDVESIEQFVSAF